MNIADAIGGHTYRTLATVGQMPNINCFKSCPIINQHLRYLPKIILGRYLKLISIRVTSFTRQNTQANLTKFPNLPKFSNVKIFELLAAHSQKWMKIQILDINLKKVSMLRHVHHADFHYLHEYYIVVGAHILYSNTRVRQSKGGHILDFPTWFFCFIPN